MSRLALAAAPGLLAEGFRFNPGSLPWIHLAWSVPAVLLLYLYGFHRKRLALRVFASSEVLSHLIPSVSWARHYAKCALVLGGMLCAVLAVARPQWGTDLKEIRRTGIDLVVLLDLSKSMLAEDVPPNRLEWAKADLSELLGGLSGDRVALVPFAGRAEIRCPLTFDYGFFRRILSDLRVGSVALGGTAVGDAIRKGLECFQDTVRNHKAILLITDGEDHESYVREAAEAARKAGVRIFAIGVGDTGEGKRIPITDEQGNKVYLQDKDGKEVWSKMDPRVLLEAAQLTEGFYAPAYLRKGGDTAGEVTTVRDLYAKIAEKVAKKELEGAQEERYRDRFQWFLGLAFALLAIEPLVRTRKRAPAAPAGPAPAPPARPSASRAPTARQPAAAAKTGGAAILLAAAVLLSAGRAEAGEYRSLLAEGNRLYAEKDFAGAEEKYLAARTERQDSAEVSYNIANTHFQRGDFPKAIEVYGDALKEARDRELEARIRYNLACARARESERFVADLANQESLQKGVDLLRQAIGGFRDVLEIDPRHQNAQKNLSIAQLRVKNLLDELKRLREEAEKKAKEEREKQQSPVEVLKQLIEEEKAEIGLTADARKTGEASRTLGGYRDRLRALGQGAQLASGLKEILADPAFALGAAEASEALKLGESGDAAGAGRKLGESLERIQKEISARDEETAKTLEKDRNDQAQTMARTVGLARGLRDAAEGKQPPAPPGQPQQGGAPPTPPPAPQPPPPEVADRLVAVAQLCEEANSKMGGALGALGKEEAPADLAQAESSQRAALEILEKALAEAEKLPREEPPPEQKKEDQQDKKDDQQKDQQKKDEKDQKKDEGKDQEKKDQSKEKEQGKQGGQGKEDKKEEKKMSKEEAEQILRKLAEKDAQRRRDRERRAAGSGAGRAALDKDW